MVENAELYKKFLEKNKINNFEIQEVGDAHHSVIFRSMVSHRGQYTPIGIIFDDTIYIIIRVNFAPKALDDENAYAVSNFIMRLNHANKLLKYYLAPDTSVILDICIPTLPGHFSPELVQTLLGVAVREVEAHQSEFMKLIWQDATAESEKKDDAAKPDAKMAKTETMDESVATAANDEETEDDEADARPEMKVGRVSYDKDDTASKQTEQIAETAQVQEAVKAEQEKQDEQVEQTGQAEQVTQAEALAPKRRVTRRAAPKSPTMKRRKSQQRQLHRKSNGRSRKC
ncbi:MAG: hypothetical protein ACI4OA_02640 [Selenomonadaceae bacterium]